MSVSTTKVVHTAAGNDSATEFSCSFPILDEEDVNVWVVVDATGVATLQVLDTDYTVTTSTSDGTVDYPISGDPLATGETIVIEQARPRKQSLALAAASGFSATAIQNALDQITMSVQALEAKVDRAIKVPPGESGFEIPNEVDRASAALTFDENGDPEAT